MRNPLFTIAKTYGRDYCNEKSILRLTQNVGQSHHLENNYKTVCYNAKSSEDASLNLNDALKESTYGFFDFPFILIVFSNTVSL